MHALVVDDSRAMRNILGRMLRELGFEVSEAANGREALNQLTGPISPQVIFLDWNMPEMDGFETLTTLRGQRVYDLIPIMMVTTETEQERVCQALAAGANEYVMKPFTREVIREKLDVMGIRTE